MPQTYHRGAVKKGDIITWRTLNGTCKGRIVGKEGKHFQVEVMPAGMIVLVPDPDEYKKSDTEPEKIWQIEVR